MKIQVISITGSSLEFDDVDPTETVLDFKRRIQLQVPRFAATEQILTLHGRTLVDDNKTLGDYGACDGCQIRVMINNIGGCS